MATLSQRSMSPESQAPPYPGTPIAETVSDHAYEWISIASFDGGGPGCVSQMKMMDEFMSRIEDDYDVESGTMLPADCFHVMGGTGWGAFCALLLGRIGMTPMEAYEALVETANQVYEESDKEMRMSSLRRAIEGILESRQLPLDMKLYDEDNLHQCKVVLFAAAKQNMGKVALFRSYQARRGRVSNCTAVDAVCACMANPNFFSPVSIATTASSGRTLSTVTYAGTPAGHNNPIRALIEETKLSFANSRNKKVSLILSLGTGEAGHLEIDPIDPSGYDGLAARWIVDCQKAVRDLDFDHPDATVYLRLNVPKGMSEIEATDWNPEKLGDFEVYTDDYLQDPKTDRLIEEAVRLLQPTRRFIVNDQSEPSEDR